MTKKSKNSWKVWMKNIVRDIKKLIRIIVKNGKKNHENRRKFQIFIKKIIKKTS